ncbi:MAG: NAD(P)/FAD-dependent oxidoreductase [Thermomicrobiales bacterium]
MGSNHLGPSSQADARPHIVIIGGGFAGLNAAKALNEAPVRVTMIDRRNHHVFQPLLYQVATASLSPAEIASPIRGILRGQENVTVLLAEATAIDIAKREIQLDYRVMTYDYLIVAAGARHSYFGHDEWETSAPGLKSLEDALTIRRRVLLAFEDAERATDAATRNRLLTFVVVGGGPTGVELAGALAEISRYSLTREFDHIDPRTAKIYLLEAGPRILPMFSEKLAKKAAFFLDRLGVIVRSGAMVTDVESHAVRIGSERIDANTVLWAAGVTASPLAKTLGVPLDRAGRVIIEPNLTVKGHPDVYVIGDLAALNGKDGRPLPGLAPVAMQQGKHAAANIRRAITGQPLTAFHYFNRGNMATIGRNRAIAEIGNLKLSGFFAWIAWLFVHIMYLIGFRNRLVVALQWFWSYATFQRNARLITGAPPTDEAMSHP